MIRLLPAVPGDFAALAQPTWRGHPVTPGGIEPAPVLEWLDSQAAALRAAQGWGAWIALSQAGVVVGSVALKAPARDGSAEIGYGVGPGARGQGHGTAMVKALLPLLHARGLVEVRAETALGNPASARVLEKAGFSRLGQRDGGEDGLLDLWRIAL